MILELRSEANVQNKNATTIGYSLLHNVYNSQKLIDCLARRRINIRLVTSQSRSTFGDR